MDKAIACTIDAEGWITLPCPVVVKTGLTLACPPSWLAAGKAQILDHHALITLNRRIARLRTSGMMPMVTTLETIYRKHAVLCRHDPGGNRIELPPRIRDAFGPLPAPITITPEDGHLTLRAVPR